MIRFALAVGAAAVLAGCASTTTTATADPEPDGTRIELMAFVTDPS